MITKITYRTQGVESFTPFGTAPRNFDTFEELAKQLEHEGKYIESLKDTVKALIAVPDSNIAECLKLIAGIAPHVTTYTKKKRSYSIPCLTVWEEDVELDWIEYQGKKYPVRTLNIPTYGTVNVSVQELSKLVAENESPEAIAVDEAIFFYIDSFYITYSDKDLVNQIKRSL